MKAKSNISFLPFKKASKQPSELHFIPFQINSKVKKSDVKEYFGTTIEPHKSGKKDRFEAAFHGYGLEGIKMTTGEESDYKLGRGFVVMDRIVKQNGKVLYKPVTKPQTAFVWEFDELPNEQTTMIGKIDVFMTGVDEVNPISFERYYQEGPQDNNGPHFQPSFALLSPRSDQRQKISKKVHSEVESSSLNLKSQLRADRRSKSSPLLKAYKNSPSKRKDETESTHPG